MESVTNYSLKNILKQALVYGLILGALISVINILDYTVGFHEQNHLANNIKYLSRILGLLICVLIFRSRAGGYMSFNTVFTFSLFAFVFAMALYDTISCVIFNVYPDLLLSKVETTRTSLLSAKVSSDIAESSINSTLWVKNPYYIIFSFLIWVLIVAPIVSFVFALMLQKSPIIEVEEIEEDIQIEHIEEEIEEDNL